MGLSDRRRYETNITDAYSQRLPLPPAGYVKASAETALNSLHYGRVHVSDSTHGSRHRPRHAISALRGLAADWSTSPDPPCSSSASMFFACTPVTSVAFVACARRDPSQRETVAMHENCRGRDDRHFRWQCPMNSRPAPQYFVRKCSRPYQSAFAR